MLVSGSAQNQDTNLQRGNVQSLRSLELLQTIWDRPLHKLATSKDLVRLCNSLIIQNECGQKVSFS